MNRSRFTEKAKHPDVNIKKYSFYLGSRLSIELSQLRTIVQCYLAIQDRNIAIVNLYEMLMKEIQPNNDNMSDLDLQ